MTRRIPPRREDDVDNLKTRLRWAIRLVANAHRDPTSIAVGKANAYAGLIWREVETFLEARHIDAGPGELSMLVRQLSSMLRDLRHHVAQLGISSTDENALALRNTIKPK